MCGIGAHILIGAVPARGVAALFVAWDPLDPAMLGTAVLVTAGASTLATWLPAGRIARIDPAVAIRSD